MITKNRTARFILSFGLVLGLLPTSVPTPQVEQGSAPREQYAQIFGQSTTVLADGRLLLIGGEGPGGPLATAFIRDPKTSTDVQLKKTLTRARAWHTATVLPDGTVFILGGIGSGNQVMADAELFDPDTGKFSLLPDTGLTSRAHHTATLLTNCELLVVGGASNAGGLATVAELYDFRSQASMPLQDLRKIARKGHQATLLADGRVLLEEGTGENGDALDYSEIFDPETRAVTVEASPLQQAHEGIPPVLEASLPEAGAVDVPLDWLISLRFSSPLSVETVTPDTLKLGGPDGVVAAKVVAAEHGRLAFITADAPLRPQTTYRVLLTGAVDRSSLPLEPTEFSFTTGALLTDDEDWIPNARNLNGDWRSNRPDSRWTSLPPLKAPRGVTALAGQALTLNGQPLANVTLEIDGIATRSDRTGRFLLSSLTPGHHELLIDGRSANKPRKTYGIFEAGVNVIEGETSVLPYTIWMPKIDTLHTVTVPAWTTSEVVVTTPLIPGLELRIPPNTTIYDIEGKPVTQVSITPIPTDRTPFPLPDGVYVPVYFTVQPGGAYVQTWSYGGARGARLIYPNYNHEPAGKRVHFWHYDPDDKGWYTYGQGTVMPGARQVVPDPGVAIYEFTGAMISSLGDPPSWFAAFWDWLWDGEPVDLGSGLFILDKTDLYLPDTLPLVLSRTYRQGDSKARAFGRGATHFYEIFLWSVNNFQQADLIMPDGARIHYVRISSGTGFTDAIYEHTETPSPFYKSRISWNGNGWDLKLKNGTVFVFGDLAPLQSIRDRYGNTTTITRTNGQTGNITKVTSPNGRWIEFTYDGSNRITQAKDNIGRIVAYSYDGNGRLSTVTDPKGGVTTYTYDGSHRMLTLKDARNIVFLTNEYDTNGRVMKQTQADGSVFTFSYTLDPNGRVTQTNVTNPRGHVRKATFNSSGYSLTDTFGFGSPQQQAYTLTRQTGSNFLVSMTDALARTTSLVYDTMGNVTSFTRMSGTPDAVTTSATYEATFNQIASVTDPLSHTTSFGYDTAGNLTTFTDALSNQTTLTYNAAGLPLTVRDPLGNTYQLTYDLGDLVGIADPLGNSVNVFRDAAGRVISLINPLGQVSRYEYDALNLLTKITDPHAAQTTFTYDANGNLLTLADARGGVTTYTHDSMDRLLTRQDPLLVVESYEYDQNGNLTKHTDRRGKVTTFTYDPLDRLTFAAFGTVIGPPTTYESTITATYDGANRPSTLVDSVSGTIIFSFDNRDNLKSEVAPNGTVNYAYDTADRQTSLTVIGQQPVTYSYDNADRLTSITQGTSSVSIAYDAASRRTSMTLPNGIAEVLSYDLASRLTGMTYSLGATTLGALTYTYDQAGRRTQIGGSFARSGLPQAVATASHDAANRLTNWGGAVLTYDSNGNLTGDGTTSYTWNARNELATVAGGATGSFQYDPVGRRTRRTASGTTTDYFYDGLNPVQELSAGTPTANLLTGLGIDEYFSRTDSLGSRSLLTDALGSTVALADSAGVLQTQYTYEPFGKTTVAGESSSSSFQFTGRESDATGLYYYRGRYLSPSLNRFISEDPIEFAGGDVNLYAYVGNSPPNDTDPTGENPLLLACAGGAAINLGGDLLAGRYVTPGSLASGCVGGLAGFGLAKGIGAAGSALGRAGIGVKFGIHPAHHPFGVLGKLPHLQWDFFRKGVKGSGVTVRIPLPRWWRWFR